MKRVQVNTICKGLSRDTGKKCNRKVNGVDYCWQHDSQFIVKRKDIKYKTPIQHKIDNTKTDIITTEELLQYYSNKLLNAVDLDDITYFSTETALLQAKLDEHNSNLKKFYEEKKNSPRDVKKIKVKGVVKKVSEGVTARERRDEDVTKMSEMFLKSFISNQKNFEYKKRMNKKI